jgi:hypothetical protein
MEGMEIVGDRFNAKSPSYQAEVGRKKALTKYHCLLE